MGMIRGAVDKTSSMKDIISRGPRRDTVLGSDRTPPATGREYRDPETDIGVQPSHALDSSRSRGYGRYEI
jgi:hypothetical protein